MDFTIGTQSESASTLALMDQIKHLVKTINIENYLDCLLTKINETSNMLTTIHTIIGSHVNIPMNIPDGEQQDIELYHEFPMIVNRLFTDPTKQFTAELFNHLLNYTDFNISQVMFLVDPLYSRDKHPSQFIRKMFSLITDNFANFQFDHTMGKFIMHQRKEISPSHFVNIHSHLEVFIIPDNISIDHVRNAIQMVNTFSQYNPVIMNIMDCSSCVMQPIYVHNTDSDIFVTEPSCTFKDSEPENVPVITLTKCSVYGGIKDIIVRRLRARWVNLKDDTEHLPTWRIIGDVCEQTRMAHHFLTNLILNRYINIDLIGVYKLWYLFNLNIEYEYPSHIDPTVTKKICFKDIDYMLFSELAKDRKFIDYIIYRTGVYHKEHMIYIIKNYNDVIKTNIYLQSSKFNNMNFVMKQLVLDIFAKLSVNIPGTIGYYEDDMVDLKFLHMFFDSRHVHL